MARVGFVRWFVLALIPLAALASIAAVGAPRQATVARQATAPAKKPAPVDSGGYESVARPFLDKNCVPCHGGGVGQQGTFRADRQLSARFADAATRARWAEVVNVLNSHTMPPKGVPQPAPADVSKFVDWITRETIAAESLGAPRGNVLRRLTRDEYKNTIRDLIGVEFDVSGFPADPPAGGFDNNARALTVSPLHVELYMNAARQILDRALVSGPTPAKVLWRFDPKCVPEDSRRIKLDEKNNSVIVNGGNNRESGEFVVARTNGWDKSVNARNFAVPTDGTYIVRLRAAARVPGRAEVVSSATAILKARLEQQIRENPKGEKWHREAFARDVKHFETDPMYDYGPARVKLVQHLGSQPKTIAEFDVDAPATAPKVYEIRARFTTESAGLNFVADYSVPSVVENFWLQGKDEFARPELWVDGFEIEGPIHESWPPPSHTRILFPSPLAATDERAYARQVIGKFLRRAYRRPVAAAEIDSKLALFDRVRKDETFLEAIKAPLIAALCSPNFLFLAEPGEKRSLIAHELAARLSYFLWGTTPDNELSALADSGKLTRTPVLLAQTTRLLADPRSGEYVRRFAGQWLGLSQVGANPPAADLFPGYDRHYETSLVAESEAFFAEVLRRDLDAKNLIRSDFAVVNERLAREYGIKNVRGDHFRKVAVTPEIHRGGIVTQASILTLTSNGTRTSPVKRGVWILKTLLDSDPGLPVANVGEIASKLDGIEKATVRKRLEFHRTRAQCARCHSQIDPLGFALENFNAAGVFREREGFGYRGRVESNDPQVDASAELPDGTKIVGVDGLQRALLARADDFLRALSKKQLTFALGREMTVADRPLVAGAVAHMKKNNNTLRSLIEYTVQCDEFRGR